MPQQPPDPAVVLTTIADASDVAKALDEYSPPHEGYQQAQGQARRAARRERRGRREVRAHSGRSERKAAGGNDARVPLLRKRLNVPGDEDNLRYDNDLVEAVKTFQKGKGVKDDGVLSANTVKLLNGAAPPRRGESIDTIVINMERWRWLPRDMGKAYVIVNIPDYMLRVVQGRPPALADSRGGGQAEPADAAAHRADEVHHGQSDLERAAVDHQQRVPAGAGSRIRPCSTAWA